MTILRSWLVGCVLIGALIGVGGAAAQDGGPTPRPVTDDEVNAVARLLYCPVCPNERLDTCQTAACASWRDEIRDQLAAGRTESQIVAYFVANYGERAVGVPQDPLLQAFSVITPIVIGVLAFVGGALFLRAAGRIDRAQPQLRRPPVSPARPNAYLPPEHDPAPHTDDAAYRDRIERDVQE